LFLFCHSILLIVFLSIYCIFLVAGFSRDLLISRVVDCFVVFISDITVQIHGFV